MKGTRVPSEDEIIGRVVVRFNVTATAFIMGLLLGAGLFFATLWLLLKGGPHPGLHLGLLGQYFPGYSVTYLGAVIGFFYAFLVGFLTGAAVGLIYNKLAR